jgi:signal transduction histidine kinase
VVKSLKVRIIGIVVIPLIVQLSLVARLSYLQGQFEAALKRAERYSQSMKALSELDTSLLSWYRKFEHLKVRPTNARDSFLAAREAITAIGKEIVELKQLAPNDPDLRAAVDRCEHMKNQLLDFMRLIAVNVFTTQDEEERIALNRKFGEAIDESLSVLSHLESVIMQGAVNQYARSNAVKSEEKYLIALVAVINLIFSGYAAFVLSRGASHRLTRLRSNVENYKTGKPLLKPVDGQDEIAIVENAFFDTASALREAAQRQKDLISMFTHDLRSPLLVMKFGLEELLESSVDEENQTLLQRMSNSVDRATELVADLLDLYKSESGMMTFEFADFDVSQAVEEVSSSLEPIARKLAVSLQLSVTADNTIIRSDRTAVVRIIQNFISNAIKHSPPNTKVAITCAKTLDGCEVRVKDQGAGIRPAELDVIFNRYQQASSARNSRLPGLSSGLGLTICREFAEKLGGKVFVVSRPGDGAEFVFSLRQAAKG